MNTQFKVIAAALVSTTALAACNGGSNSMALLPGNTDAQRVLAKTAGSASKALADGKTLRASQRTSSGIARNYDEKTARALADGTATVTRNSAGGLDLKVAGRKISFSPADINADGSGYEIDGAGLWAWSANSMAKQLDPANGQHSMVFDYYSDTGDSTGQNGFVLVGTETDPADLAKMPKASYAGWSRVRVAPEKGFTNWDKAVSDARGDVSLTADFGAGEVSGAISKIQARAPRAEDPSRSWEAIDGKIALESARIDGNGFSGAVSGDAAFSKNVGRIDRGSTYSGTFFGDKGQEVGGGIRMTGKSAEDGGSFVGWGAWQARKK